MSRRVFSHPQREKVKSVFDPDIEVLLPGSFLSSCRLFVRIPGGCGWLLAIALQHHNRLQVCPRWRLPKFFCDPPSDSGVLVLYYRVRLCALYKLGIRTRAATDTHGYSFQDFYGDIGVCIFEGVDIPQTFANAIGQFLLGEDGATGRLGWLAFRKADPHSGTIGSLVVRAVK